MLELVISIAARALLELAILPWEVPGVAVASSARVLKFWPLSSTTGTGWTLDKLRSVLGPSMSLEFLLHLAKDLLVSRVCAIGWKLYAHGLSAVFPPWRCCPGAFNRDPVAAFGVGAIGVTLVALSYVGDPSLDMGLAMVLAIDSDLGTGRTRHTGDELVIGLPNSLVTIGLVRLNSGAGLVGVLTEILGIPGGVTTDSTAR